MAVGEAGAIFDDLGQRDGSGSWHTTLGSATPAEQWYASMALEDLLGIPESEVTKDRLYQTRDVLRQAKDVIENDLKEQLGALFQ